MPAPQAFITQIAADAIQACANTGVWPSVVLAQGIQESGSGTSKLAAYNNLFGHKASLGWLGETIRLVAGGSLWRVYDSVYDCIKAHIGILHHPKYLIAGVTSAKTPEAQAQALQKAGYDTGPDKEKYAAKLIRIIDQYGLKTYDDAMIAMQAKQKRG